MILSELNDFKNQVYRENIYWLPISIRMNLYINFQKIV
ncbi:hypothetical protein N41_2490 [Lactococcus cremoris]|nr:hypothetical protein V4_1909 [Lactococcus cremoris]KZK33593.1 hypothetical protein N41_2490 [Lactococcus cremoris]